MAASSSRESIARNNSSLGAVFRVSTVMARSSVKRPDCAPQGAQMGPAAQRLSYIIGIGTHVKPLEH